MKVMVKGIRVGREISDVVRGDGFGVSYVKKA
jgi:hypothetical protein